MTYWNVNFMHLNLNDWILRQTRKVDPFKIPAIEVGAAYLHFYFYYLSENEIPTDKSGKMTAGLIKTLGFQDWLSGIALSFDYVNFVNKN